MPEAPDAAPVSKADQTPEKLVLYIPSDRLGGGPEELGRVLLRSFLKTCKELPRAPWRALFLNSGIALTTEGSPLVDDLLALQERGTEILSCGTCLDYFGAKDRLRVGRVSNMTEIVHTLTTAGRVLRP